VGTERKIKGPPLGNKKGENCAKPKMGLKESGGGGGPWSTAKKLGGTWQIRRVWVGEKVKTLSSGYTKSIHWLFGSAGGGEV